MKFTEEAGESSNHERRKIENLKRCMSKIVNGIAVINQFNLLKWLFQLRVYAASVSAAVFRPPQLKAASSELPYFFNNLMM